MRLDTSAVSALKAPLLLLLLILMILRLTWMELPTCSTWHTASPHRDQFRLSKIIFHDAFHAKKFKLKKSNYIWKLVVVKLTNPNTVLTTRNQMDLNYCFRERGKYGIEITVWCCKFCVFEENNIFQPFLSFAWGQTKPQWSICQ